jgi:hypothetical protein
MLRHSFGNLETIGFLLHQRNHHIIVEDHHIDLAKVLVVPTSPLTIQPNAPPRTMCTSIASSAARQH